MNTVEKFIRSWMPSKLQSSIRNNPIFRNYRAQYTATHKNRLDLCASEIANYLFLSRIPDKYPIRGKVCLEIGTGWVMSHTLVFYLLGAKKIYATDVADLLSLSSIRYAIQSSIDYIINDGLAGFEDHSLVKERLERLYAIDKFSLKNLEELGIEYIAPIDLVEKPLGKKIDFIYSKAVLEHIPEEEVKLLLKNVMCDLSENGNMFHLIHLEDHLDIPNKPFEFLKEPKENFPKAIQNQRGNRIRSSLWKHIFDNTDNLDYRVAFEWSRKDRSLPETIDSSISYIDEDDLRVSHLGIFGTKVALK
ncbi:MAG: hypothetical protein ACFB02_02525 [Mastigocoleus sp.]